MKRRSVFRKNDGFTLVEMIVASLVLAMVFISSISALTYGFKLMENARFNTLASQVIQSEIETLRLNNWLQLNTLPAHEAITIPSGLASAAFNRFAGWRTVSSVIRTDTKLIIVGVQWTASSGQVHARRYTTYMTKDGLNDYYYTKL
jgi:prepilin-type N-terminal cleavage/methylation domain-containing protein